MQLHTTYEHCPKRKFRDIRFERSDAIEICDGLMFIFYPEVPHMLDSTFAILKTGCIKLEKEV